MFCLCLSNILIELYILNLSSCRLSHAESNPQPQGQPALRARAFTGWATGSPSYTIEYGEDTLGEKMCFGLRLCVLEPDLFSMVWTSLSLVPCIILHIIILQLHVWLFLSYSFSNSKRVSRQRQEKHGRTRWAKNAQRCRVIRQVDSSELN